ncbi:MAG: tetratricopeptide repeat protein [Candidatus Binatia bacterium]
MILALVFISAALWAGSQDVDQAILFYQHKLQRRPTDVRSLHGLGDAFIKKARVSGDFKYFDLAAQALTEALKIDPGNGGVLRHMAYVSFSRHEFQQAVRQAARALELNPADAHAYGVLGDSHLELGEYEETANAYGKMIELDRGFYAHARMAGLRSIRGDTSGAITDLEAAIESGRKDAVPRESLAWAQWQLGNEYFSLGMVEQAENQYLKALNTHSNYYRALAGMAQARAARKKYPEAIQLYQKALGIIPLPEYAAALGDLLNHLGQSEESARYYRLVEYIGRLSAANQVIYNRELAYFYADHDLKLAVALELAQKEIEIRKDVHGYDVLAWTLYKNERYDEALQAIQEALKLGTRDAKLFFHAGMIYRRLGETEKAKEFLSRALVTNAHFHILQADVARRALAEMEARGAAVAHDNGHGE